MVRKLSAAILFASFLSAAAGAEDPAVRYLSAQGQAPADYVLAKLRDHRVVILGEAHWLRHDAELILDLVPRLASAGVEALALEVFPASSQAEIDRIVGAEAWDPAAALSVLRAAGWPYREHLDLLHAAWEHNAKQPPGGKRLQLIALGPGSDWRERLLPRGEDYDQFMARLVLGFLRQPSRRVLVYSGLHHAFTHYYQPELPRARRVERFMDRMGNILWRELGEEVFLILLPAPWQCREGVAEDWLRCLPLHGAVDCAAAQLGRPVGFDVVRSPFAELRITPDFLYAQGYPSLRLGDLADGYVWSRPIEDYRAVSLIPLSELAPDPESLAQIVANNPFADQKGLGRADLEALWTSEADRLREIQKSRGWQRLSGWREACASLPRSPSP